MWRERLLILKIGSIGLASSLYSLVAQADIHRKEYICPIQTTDPELKSPTSKEVLFFVGYPKYKLYLLNALKRLTDGKVNLKNQPLLEENLTLRFARNSRIRMEGDLYFLAENKSDELKIEARVRSMESKKHPFTASLSLESEKLPELNVKAADQMELLLEGRCQEEVFGEFKPKIKWVRSYKRDGEITTHLMIWGNEAHSIGLCDGSETFEDVIDTKKLSQQGYVGVLIPKALEKKCVEIRDKNGKLLATKTLP